MYICSRKKIGVATNLVTEEVVEALARLGREKEYGGLKCFKVEEGEEVGNGVGGSAQIWLLSATTGRT